MKRHFTKSPLCQLCELTFFKQRQSSLGRPFQRNLTLTRPSSWPQNPRVIVKPVTVKTERKPITKESEPSQTDRESTNKSTQIVDNQGQLEDLFRRAEQRYNTIFSSKDVPKELDLRLLLKYYDLVAEHLVRHVAPTAKDGQKKTSASNALLSLDEQTPKAKTQTVQTTPPFVRDTIDKLSEYAFAIVTNPLTYITPDVLNAYISLQAKLGKPETFPDVFHLYANKPIPTPGSSPIRYKKQNPNKLANAVAKGTVEIALNSAIQVRQLGVAINIIQTTFATKAYRRMKTLQKCFLPATSIGLAPVALYTVATQFADFQSTMDNEIATKVAFAGMISYLGLTGTIGFIAVSTANDQMDRVTWTPGIPLRRRWLQEDERAAYDKIAGAWGFRELWRRGEEEGDEWEMLRECIGMKGMILDRTSLMEGMQ